MAIVTFPRTRAPFAGGRLRVQYGHPLAQGLVGAFVLNPSGSRSGNGAAVKDPATIDLMYGYVNLPDDAAGAPTTHRVSPSGPTRSGKARSSSGTTADGILPIMKPPVRFSVFWYGVVTANTTSFGAHILGVSYQGGAIDAFAIYRINDNTSVQFICKSGGTTFGPVVASVIASSDYLAVPMSLGMTVGFSTIYGYKNGRIVGSAAGPGANVTYASAGTANDLGVSSTAGLPATSPDAKVDTSVAYLWNRELNPTEHLILAQNPYQLFTASRAMVGPFVTAGSTLAIFDNHYKQQGIR